MTICGTCLLTLRRSAFLFLIVLLLPAGINAQYFNTGQDPFRTKWESLETSSFRIVYDQPFRAEALRLARLMESYRLPASASLGADPEPITVIIHNRSSISNAMVPIAPRRLEFYPLAPQDGLSQEWFRHLAIHEYRHVAQIDQIDTGLTKVLGYVFGEQAHAAVFGVMQPFWFIEGDATVIETALGQSGRGRQPDFYGPLRTQLLERGVFSYNKAVFRSYREPVPNRYELGYHLVAMGRYYYGPELWSNALTNSGKNPWMIRPFSQSLRRQTGLGVVRFYEAMMDSLQNSWTTAIAEQEFDSFPEHPTKARRVYADYLHPVPYKDASIICLRKRIDDIPRFVLIDSLGREKVLFTPGGIYDESIGYEDGVLVWAEYQSDVRWENRSYSEIWTYDIEQDKAQRLTKGTRYFAPSISKHGRRIAVSFTDELNNHELHIIDGRTGRIIHRFRHPANSQIISPRWAFNDSLIVFITAGPAGRGVQALNPLLGTFKILMAESFTELSHAMVQDQGLFFSAGLGGIRNLFVMDLEWNYIWKLTNSKHGVRDPWFDTQSLLVYYSEYTHEGYRPKAVPISLLAQARVTDGNLFSLQLADTLSKQESWDPKVEQDSFQYDIKPYRRITHLANLHSWAPLAISANSQTLEPGVSMISQDILGTTFMEAGYRIDLNERTGIWYADLSYRALYPVLYARYSYGVRNSEYIDSQNELQPFSWKESTVRLGSYLPLRFHRGKWLRWVQPSVFYSRIDLSAMENLKGVNKYVSTWLFGADPYYSTPSFIRVGLVNSLEYSVSITNQIRSAHRDIRPEWRQSLSLSYRHSPWGERTLGKMLGVNTSFTFPGIIKQHSLRIGLSAQVKEKGNSLYSYSYIIPVPRGVHGVSDDLLRYASFSYAFPLAYPDLSLGPLAYITRIRADLYAGYAIGGSLSDGKRYASYSGDIIFDGHLLRFVAPLEFGLRTTYVPDQQDWFFSFLFQIKFDDI
jgi:hypothetical protein